MTDPPETQLLEKSELARDSGAAFHLCPNANGILRQMGIHAETFGECLMSRFVERAQDGQVIKDVDLTESNKRWPHPWQLVHRAQIYQELKRVALSQEEVGPPVELVTKCHVIDVNPRLGTVTALDGTEYRADVIIGADGIYVRASLIPPCQALDSC
jgi:2-polyprenyl-6-methoxyphenol hydroxylase-like FAD-dependent oxidoreductase